MKLTLERLPGAGGAPDGLAIVKASDAAGATILPSELELRPQSLADARGHWLDTGRIAVSIDGDHQP